MTFFFSLLLFFPIKVLFFETFLKIYCYLFKSLLNKFERFK